MKEAILFYWSLLWIAPCPGQAPAKSTTKPFVLGITEEINSVILHEKRVLNLYLPEGHNESDTVNYPVIYLLDGSADEDFIHVAGLVQFHSFPWVQQVPKSILVGIANVDRRRDFTFPTSVEADRKSYPTTGHSADFIAFLERELQPYIQKKYRTNSQKTLIGESLGGLLGAEILLKKPALFTRYLLVSPSLWWDNGSLLNLPDARLKTNVLPNTTVYIGVGKEGLTPGPVPRVMEADAQALVEKLKKSESKELKVYFDYLPAENHATIGHQAISNGLRMLFAKPPGSE